MASVKDLRSKPLSSMSYDELTNFIKTATNAGYSISTSKELGKAEDLRKVLKPNKYDDKTVQSAKDKLVTNTTLETQQNLGIAPVTDTGIPGVSGSGVGFSGGGTPTSIDFNKMYEQAITSPDITNLEKEINDKKSALTAAMTEVNDNPYYSEATRTGHLAKLQATAQSELSNLTDQLAQKRADVQTKINIAKMQYDVTQQEYQNNLQRLNLLISSGALLTASGTDVAQIALATGMSTAMIKGIQSKMKSDMVKPQVITDTDNNGNVTVAVIDANTGDLISQRSLGNIGKVSTTTSNPYKPGTAAYSQAVSLMMTDMRSVAGGADKVDNYVNPDVYRDYRSQWINAGFSPSDFDNSFKQFINPTHPQDYLTGLSGQTPDAIQGLIDAINRGE